MLDFSTILGFLVPDATACRIAAGELRKELPGRTRAQLARVVVFRAKRAAATAGAATGLASSPITLAGAAAADAAAVLKIEGKMAGTVAALLDPESLDDEEAFRADVVAVVFPGLASQALRAMGVRGAQRFTKGLLRGKVGQGLLKGVAKQAAKVMGAHLTEKALLTKTLPLAGVAVGGGWNWFEVGRAGDRAIRYYGHGVIDGRARRSVTSRVVGQLRRLPFVPDAAGPDEASRKGA